MFTFGLIGGKNFSSKPAFSITNVAFLQRGGLATLEILRVQQLLAANFFTMSILLCVTDRDTRKLQRTIQSLVNKDTNVLVYPEIPAPETVEMVVAWKHPPELFSKLPNVKLVSSLGAGVEHLIKDPSINDQIRVSRIVDKNLTISMRNYVTMAVLNIHRQLSLFQVNQQEKRWEKPQELEIPLQIGVLGLGALGKAIAKFLASMGFEVSGYSRHLKVIEGVQCYSAQDTPLFDFARRINTLICLLPRTSATEGILNYSLFQKMPLNSYLINVARGAHLVEHDLMRAIHEGRIKKAYLDVFSEEPLPVDHPFWEEAHIVITPHIASVTDQDSAAEIIVENYRRLLSGRPILYEVDKIAGY